ncbi:hypothetical protein KY285_032914 [Solanum tuberosum]|nr:hypothetical protein KY285_032914 [Solanum tuberosum]
MVDPTILEVEARTCAPSMEQAGISAPSDVLYSTTVPTASVSTTVVPTLRPFPSPITHPPLTHTLIYQTGIFARSTSVRATRVEMDIPKIICRAIEKALTPLIDREWSTILEAQEKVKGSSGTLDTLRDQLATLQAEVVQFQSMGISMLWGDAPLPDAPSSMPVMSSIMTLPSE